MNLEKLDRVPTDIWATEEVWDKLRQHFGADADLYSALHIDGIANLVPKYIGPPFEHMKELPEWPPALAKATGPVNWRRQVLFIKDEDPAGADYLVLRDTTSRGQPTMW